MLFQYSVKLRSIEDHVSHASTQPKDQDVIDPWAAELFEVHERNYTEIQDLAKGALTAADYERANELINDWLCRNDDVRYSSVKFSELRSLERSGARSPVFSLVDTHQINEQVDRTLWMSQRMPDILVMHARQLLFDVSKEVTRHRKELEERYETQSKGTIVLTAQKTSQQWEEMSKWATDERKEAQKVAGHVISLLEQMNKKMDPQAAIKDAGDKLSQERREAITQAAHHVEAATTSAITHLFWRGVGIVLLTAAVTVVLRLIFKRTRGHPPIQVQIQRPSISSTLGH
jgi:hypothetical protein